MYAALKVSRSLGDLLAHHIGVKSEPNVCVQDITNFDQFITIATDSVWSQMSHLQLGEILFEFGKKDPGALPDLISHKIKERDGSGENVFDDTTLIISALSGSKAI